VQICVFGDVVRGKGLPVVERDARPRAVIFGRKIEKDVQIYSSWQNKRSLIGAERREQGNRAFRCKLNRGLIEFRLRNPSCQLGSSLAMESFAMVSTPATTGISGPKGIWFTEYIDQVVENNRSCEGPEERACYVKVIQHGAKQWASGGDARRHTGWVLASKYADIKDLSATAFDGVCADPGADGD